MEGGFFMLKNKVNVTSGVALSDAYIDGKISDKSNLTKKKEYRKVLIITFISMLIFTCCYSYKIIDNEIPDEVSVFEGENVVIKSSVPISYDVTKESLPVSANVKDGVVGKYSVQTKIFGMIPAKKVEVNVISNDKVYPCGFQIGIYLHTEGVMIIDTGEVTDINGNTSNPSKNIVLPNDYVISLNGISVSSKSQLIFLINKYGKDDIILGLRRNGQTLKVKVKPVCTGDNQYKAGIWVRDDSQGIGTLTYITKDGQFAGLGHGISDVDTGKLLSSKDGILYQADIWGIKKGEKGNPGGLLGSITYEPYFEFGKITGNTNYGIFGNANEHLMSKCESDPVEVALRQEIETGPATVRCMMNGKLKEFEIEIERVDYTNKTKDKGMVIRITDEELLSYTNGIVQGMSGSPILQNGKLIGAVTHVFVDDPTRGYAIFIETMINES